MYACTSGVSTGGGRWCAACECCESDGAAEPCPCALDGAVRNGDASRELCVFVLDPGLLALPVPSRSLPLISSTWSALGPFPEDGDPGSGGSGGGMPTPDDGRDDRSDEDSVAFAVDGRRPCPDSRFPSRRWEPVRSGADFLCDDGDSGSDAELDANGGPDDTGGLCTTAAADPRRPNRGVEGDCGRGGRASAREELLRLNHELGFFSGARSLIGVVGPCPFGNACFAGTGDDGTDGMEGAALGMLSVWLSCSEGAVRGRRCDDGDAGGAGCAANASAPLFLFSRRVPDGVVRRLRKRFLR